MRRTILVVGGLSLLLATGGTLEAQTLPLQPPKPSGTGVSPVFEGWYKNADGTFTLSFGYMNRNREEVVEIPIGPGNSVSPANLNPMVPTHFEPFRQYGVYTVKVPADWGDKDVVWTIDFRGQRYAIPGRLRDNYEIDALLAPASGETPPFMKVMGSEEVRGPSGVTLGPLTAKVGQPLTIETFARDEHSAITLRWYKYSGPGAVTFGQQQQPVAKEGATATNTVTFSAPGDYVVYVRANNSAVVSAGQEQCCWTNGYVKVTVTP
jgi:hypothetical protein